MTNDMAPDLDATDAESTESLLFATRETLPVNTAEKRYNDNYMIELSVRTILHEVGEDILREGLIDTPGRVARMYRELFSGLDEDPSVHLEKQFSASSDAMVVIRDIPFFSSCEHHLVPFHGVAHVGYIPGLASDQVLEPLTWDSSEDYRQKKTELKKTAKYRVAGLSKFARVVDVFAKRPQIQEQMTDQISTCINDTLKPQGVIVVVKAAHMCMSMRGVQKSGSWTVTTSVKGLFEKNEDGVKSEFYQMLNL